MKDKLRYGAMGGGLILAILLPQIVGIVYTNILVQFAIDAVFALSLNLLLGYGGLLSFGHAMFFGAGAYATALVLTRIPNLHLLAVVLIGACAAAFLALLLSPLLVRVSGTAFAMLTLAFGQLFYVFSLKYREVTRGEDGISGFPMGTLGLPGLGAVDLSVPSHFYYFALAILTLCVWAMWFLTRTPFGSVIIGIRDNPQRIDYLGFKVAQSKALLFVLSGLFAGVAGSLFALFQNLVSVDGALHIFVSFRPIMMAYIGGIGSFFGPILGSGVIHLLDELSSRYVRHVDLVKGVVFILVVLFAPGGVVGVYRRAKARIGGWMASRSEEGRAP
jgi:branched-chain amino acid transport system permease protein